MEGAAKRVGISPLQADFKNMRNDLIHDGRLSASRFPQKTAADCATVAGEVLNWIDQYIHTVLALGPVEHVRFSPANLQTLNAYSF